MKGGLLVLAVLATVAAPARADTDCDPGGFCYVLAADDERYEEMDPGGYWSGQAIDIVVIGDGYTEADMDDFAATARTTVDDFWKYEPFASNRCAIRFWLVRLVSRDSGITNPAESAYHDQDTALHSRFSTTTRMGIEVDPLLCSNAVVSAGLPVDADFLCVIVNDPKNHDGAWAYPTWDLMLMSGSWPWGVVLAHEMGHLIADLGDEYPCQECWREGADYLASPDWNRTYDPSSDDPVDHPNLTTTLDDMPWEPWPDTAVPTTNFDVYAGHTPGAWEGGGGYRSGVWRSQEYCIMDSFMSPLYEYFCGACSNALQNEMPDCFAIADADCMMVRPRQRGIDDLRVLEGPLRRHIDIPRQFSYRFWFDIPPFWKLMPPPADMPHPIPVYEVPVEVRLRGLPAGSVVVVYQGDDMLLAQGTASDDGNLVLAFSADTIHSYRLGVDVTAGTLDARVFIELTVNGVPFPLQ